MLFKVVVLGVARLCTCAFARLRACALCIEMSVAVVRCVLVNSACYIVSMNYQPGEVGRGWITHQTCLQSVFFLFICRNALW